MRLKILAGTAIRFEPRDDKLGGPEEISGTGIPRSVSGSKWGPTAYIPRPVAYKSDADGGFQGVDT
jgi:hypothetical protein